MMKSVVRCVTALTALFTFGSQAQPLGAQSTASAKYPKMALKLRQQGTARAQIVISAKGNVTRCSIIESSGSPYLDEDACKQANRIHAKPAVDATGKAIESTFSVKFSYRLPDQ